MSLAAPRATGSEPPNLRVVCLTPCAQGVGVETVVLVLTDVQGSTRLWQDESVAMDVAMARHHEIVHGAMTEHGGWRPVDQGEGDAVFAAFRSPSEAIAAVAQVQRGLAAEPWPTSTPLKVRIGVHVGEVTERGGNLYGDPVNRCARLRGLGAGGQTLLSAPMYELVRDKLPAGTSVTDLGEHRMKDLTRPEHVWQLQLDGQPHEFPPLSSLDRALHNLPVQRSPLIGRDDDLMAVLAALGAHRLVTLTGFGGMGKTRLALQAAAELVDGDGDGDGVWFVDLAGTSDAAAVPGLVGLATGLGGADADSVVSALVGQQLLLVLDNLEQVLDCAPFLSQLLDRVAGVRILATSREPLRLRGEQELALQPLALPPQGAADDAATLSAYAAVQLFVDRAVAVRADFAVTNDNAPAVAAICQRLDGHPLAIELAAARVKLMTPQALLPRLDKALSVLTGGSRDMPGRHQTLRAAIAWSYDLLEPDERLLLGRMSVFAGPAAFEHVEAVCGEDLDVFGALASLVDKSLVRTPLSTTGEDRYGLLLSIKEYAGEQLFALGSAEEVRGRHTAYVIAQGQLRPPFTTAERWALLGRVEELHDELAEVWTAVRNSDDEASLAAFPLQHFEAVFVRSQDTSGLDHWLERCRTPSLPLAHALFVRRNWFFGGIMVDNAELAERAHLVADLLDRPEARVLALMAASPGDATAEELVAQVAAFDELLPLVPPDSPLGRDRLLDLRDSAAGRLLQYADPDVTLAAALRTHASGSMGAGLMNLAFTYSWRGEWQQVVDLTWPVVGAGAVRENFLPTLATAACCARALAQLGRPDEALALLDRWEDEVARRGWRTAQEMQAVARWRALTAADRVTEAQASLDALGRPFVMQQTRLAALRVERLSGRGTDPAEAAALVAEGERSIWGMLPFLLSALVEQAAREPSVDTRRELLARVESYGDRVVLPYGYQDDLDRLRAEL